MENEIKNILQSVPTPLRGNDLNIIRPKIKEALYKINDSKRLSELLLAVDFLDNNLDKGVLAFNLRYFSEIYKGCKYGK